MERPLRLNGRNRHQYAVPELAYTNQQTSPSNPGRCSLLFMENDTAHISALGVIIQSIDLQKDLVRDDIWARLRNIIRSKSVGPCCTQRFQQLPCVRQYIGSGSMQSPREDDTTKEGIAKDIVRRSISIELSTQPILCHRRVAI